VVQANSDARLAALRTYLWAVALFTVAAPFVTGLIPVEPAGRPERKADPARAGPAGPG
jgi:hypothetical protein